jgi:murein DD-endopeptidase MepM/ murein hydrolase activator NlpD
VYANASREKRTEGSARTNSASGRTRASCRDTVLHFAVFVAVFFGFLAGATAVAVSTNADRPAQAVMAVPGQQSRDDGAHFAQRHRPPRTPAKIAQEAKWVSPMPGAEVTSCWGPRWGTLHKGIDYAQPENTPINAASAGTVFGVGSLYAGYGISVVIDHGDGIFTHYAHLNNTTVTEGQTVNASQLIGHEGSTGDSTGPHLHFEVHQGLWNQLDPGPWMRARGVDVKC